MAILNGANSKVIIPTEEQLADRQREADLARAYAAESVTYDPTKDLVCFTMVSGITLQIPRAKITEISRASQKALAELTIGIGGDVLELASLDVDISIPGLLRDLLGLNTPQRLGGLSRTPEKAAASRANGLLGGRPPKAKSATNGRKGQRAVRSGRPHG